MNITNPILRGFNPDPSILRVGDDYYIATSTFEWYPGVQIHHSRDLAHWRLITRPLRWASQLDMRGDPDSCGVWAPCLSHAEGLFYLIGQRRVIFRGTAIGFTEGPHLYKHGGYYHLIVAEGGTFWGHAVTMARSRSIEGPYELHPDTYVLTARDRPDSALHRAGHGSL